MKHVTFGTASEAAIERDNDENWYSKKELANIRREAHDLFKEVHSIEECLRGLEIFQEGVDNRKKRRHNFVQALLAVQMEMSNMNMYDPKGLQAFAAAHSIQDSRAARRRGKQDAVDVNQSKGGGVSKLGKRPTFTKNASSRRFQPQHVADAAKCA